MPPFGLLFFRLTPILKALYTFFGVALLVGIITGTSLHYLSSFIHSALGLDSVELSREGTVHQLLGSRQKRENAEDDCGMKEQSSPKLAQGNDGDDSKELKRFGWLNKEWGRPRRGLIHKTIIEEDDSSEIGF